MRNCVVILLLLPVLLTAQNVGINTSSPLFHLDVRASTVSENALLNLASSDNMYFTRLLTGHSGAPNSSLSWTAGTAFNFGMWDEQNQVYSQVLQLSQLHRVGINTFDPAFSLDVRGLDDFGHGGELQLATPGETHFMRLFGGRGGDQHPFISFADTDTFHFVTSAPDWSNFSRRITLLPTGNMGIGWEDAAARLHIGHNSDNASPGLRITEYEYDYSRILLDNVAEPGTGWLIAGRADSSAASSRFNLHYLGTSESGDLLTVRGNGNVGISTSNPVFDLDVRGPAGSELGAMLQLATPTQTNAMRLFGGRPGDPHPFIAFTDTDTFHISRSSADWSNYAILMTMTPDGKMGIGKEQPEATLDVGGKIKVGDDMAAPSAGQIRWNAGAGDFEGYDGTKWISLTGSPKQSGNIAFHENINATSSDGAPYNNFGGEVAVSGDIAVVAAPNFDYSDPDDEGQAYVFQNVNDVWAEVARLTATGDPGTSDTYGGSVAIDGETIVLGTYDITLPGKVFVYVKPGGGWADMTQTATLTPSDGMNADWFGHSVSIESNTIVVGASNWSTETGKAYVYEKPGGGWTNMTETAQLTASDATNGDWFGRAVDLFETTILVTADANDVGGVNNAGKAYIYEKPGGSWVNMTETAQFTCSDASSGHQLGIHAALSADVVVLGYTGDIGKAYLYEKPAGGWINAVEDAQLTSGNTVSAVFYGFEVAIDGDVIILGMPAMNETIGYAYIFDKPATGWTDMVPSRTLSPSDPEEGAKFGRAIDLDAQTIVIGAPGKDISADEDRGKVYFFDR